MRRFTRVLVGLALSGAALAHAARPVWAQQPSTSAAVPPSTDTTAKKPSTTASKSSAAKPGSNCILDFEGSQGNDITRAVYVKQASGNYNAFIGGRVVGHCRGQDMTLKSDSAEFYGDQNMVYLIGNVHYIEPRVKIDADRATYWTQEGHLHAEGNVYAVTDSGNTMRGPVAEYYRVVPGLRTEPSMTAIGRPRLGLVQHDSVTKAPSDTVYVDADRINSVNNTLAYAGGNVLITRPDMVASGDSAFINNTSGKAELMINPKVQSNQKDHPFTLTGGLIDVYSSNKQVNRIVASPNGHAVSNDLQLYADSIDMRVDNRQLQRAIAWGKTRARAVSPDRDIIADSIDAIMPNQQVEEIHAVRAAYATSIPDSTTIITSDRDWLRGDTIIAVFDTTHIKKDTATVHDTGVTADTTHRPARTTARKKSSAPKTQASVTKPVTTPPDTLPPSVVDMTVASKQPAGKAKPDSSKSPPIKLLRAVDAHDTNARAYYHLANQDKIKDKPGVNYVRGRAITLNFKDRAVQTVVVNDQASGVYLEAITDSTKTTEPSRKKQPGPKVPPIGATPRRGVR
jgi:lipopolysaccharide export system protein LptA